jgi:hypothetical protein
MDNQFKEEIKNRLLANNPQAKVTDKYIQKLTCPACNKNEAWTYIDNPLVVICQRGNECYAITPTKDIIEPISFGQIYPATKDNPNATAIAYLQSRGLDTDKIENYYYQSTWKENQKTYQTVAFRIDNIICHRLIDYNGKDKVRFQGSYKDIVYQTYSEIDFNQDLWITEGIIDALSLKQKGKQAIAILSSAHFPEIFYKKLIEQINQRKKESSDKLKFSLIFSFDNDDAGYRAIDKHIEFFRSQDIAFQIALTPKDKDWNDCLLLGYLKDDFFEECLWRGRLYQASNIEQYHAIYSEYHFNVFTSEIKFYTGLLEFKDSYWFIGFSKEKENYTPNYTKLSDFTLKPLFSIQEELIEYEPDITHIVEVIRDKDKKRAKFTANDLCQSPDFKRKVMKSAKGLWLSQKIEHLNALVEYLFKQEAPLIRKLQATGYDYESGCYVFGNFLYDEIGKRVAVNKDGYFEKQKIYSLKDKNIIPDFEITDLKEFLDLLKAVYGCKAWLVFGYYVSTLFAHIIYSDCSYNAFPFLSIFGVAHTGKTTLIDTLNAMCFYNWPGISMNNQNTRKGLLKNLSKKYSIPIALLESNGQLYGISEDQLLNAYHWSSLYERSKTSNDNETYSLPFKAGLVFVQNVEPFSFKTVKQRVASIEFLASDTTAQSSIAMQQLKKYSAKQLAGLGHQILTKRKEIEKALPECVKDIQAVLSNNSIDIERIAFSYAVCLAGFMLTADLFGYNYSDELIKETLKWSKHKLDTSTNQSALGDQFFEAFETLKIIKNENNSETSKLTLGVHYLEDDKHYYIRLTECLRVMHEQRYAFATNQRINEELKKHDKFEKDNFTKYSKDWLSENKYIKVWEFKK